MSHSITHEQYDRMTNTQRASMPTAIKNRFNIGNALRDRQAFEMSHPTQWRKDHREVLAHDTEDCVV